MYNVKKNFVFLEYSAGVQHSYREVPATTAASDERRLMHDAAAV